MSSRTEQRKKEFKKGLTAEDGRRRREENSTSIRKTKKEDITQKRRQFAEITSNLSMNDSTFGFTSVQEIFIQQVNSNDEAQQLEGTTQFRKLLSLEKNPPIQEVISSGVVPRFVQFLAQSQNPKLKFEAAWAVTNIASGNSDQTKYVIQLNAVPIFVQLLSSADEELREQAVWALGNIAGDSTQCRDYVLQVGALQPLLYILNTSIKNSMTRNATWALSNMCRGKPQPSFESVSPCLPVLARLIQHPDTEVVIDALWALSYVSDGNDNNIEAVIQVGVLPKVIELLHSSNTNIQTPALRTLGNIVTGNDNQTQAAIDTGALQALKPLLNATKKNLKKEAAWAISNITAGNKHQTQLVINHEIFPALIRLMGSAEFDVKKEATWAVSNATTWKSYEQIRYLITQGVAAPLCELLTMKDPKIILVVLDAIENILAVGQMQTKNGGENPFCRTIEEADGIDRLEELQEHQNDDIYQKSVKIIEDYFGGEEEDENIAPTQTQNSFNFAANATPTHTHFNF